MSEEANSNISSEAGDDMSLSETQIRKVLRNQFNPQARRKIEDLQEERALRRLLENDYY